MSYTIFLDMDGVLADFVTAVSELFEFDPASVVDWGFVAQGITTDQLWRRIDEEGLLFWDLMPHFTWTQELFELCQRQCCTQIFTTPSQDSSSAAGKMVWMQSRWGLRFRDFQIGCNKECIASPTKILIDDNNENVKKFITAGGQAILFPQPWNTNRGLCENRIGWVKRQLRIILGNKYVE